jgi:hypothetical protein
MLKACLTSRPCPSPFAGCCEGAASGRLAGLRALALRRVAGKTERALSIGGTLELGPGPRLQRRISGLMAGALGKPL